MKAVILAAGRGKRMHHLTEETPKPLLKVSGKTFLDIIFDALPEEVNEIIVVIGYQGEKIKSYLGDNYRGRKIHCVVQRELSGTGKAVLLTKEYFNPGERFLIFYADELISKTDVKDCLTHEFSWLCWKVADSKASGIATISQDGFITKITEKPKSPESNLGVTGLLVVNTDIFQYAPEAHETGEYYLTSMMNGFVKDHKVYPVIGANRPSFSTPEDLAKIN